MRKNFIRCFLLFSLIIFVFILLPIYDNYETIARSKPNVSIIDNAYKSSKESKDTSDLLKAQNHLHDLSKQNQLLALELGKLPELQDGVTSEDLAALERICALYNLDPSSFDKAFESMYHIGLPEIRKYNTPLKALLWLAEKGSLNEYKNVIVDYSLNTLLDEAWSNKDLNEKKWDDFKTVADRLNAPELLDYYIDHNFRKIIMPAVIHAVLIMSLSIKKAGAVNWRC
jgi:hypothetical protein